MVVTRILVCPNRRVRTECEDRSITMVVSCSESESQEKVVSDRNRCRTEMDLRHGSRQERTRIELDEDKLYFFLRV